MKTTNVTPLPAAIIGLLARCAIALPDAWSAHEDGVPRDLVEELLAAVHANTLTQLPAATVGLLARCAGALPDASFANDYGVPRDLVEELQAVVRANNVAAALYPEDALPEDWSRQVLFHACASNAYEDVSPQWAALRVTPPFLREVRRLFGVLHANGLEEVRVGGAPDRWDIDPDTAMAWEALVVSRQGLHFVASPMQQDVDIETVMVSVPAFLTTVLNATDPVIVLGESSEDDRELIAAWEDACSEAISATR